MEETLSIPRLSRDVSHRFLYDCISMVFVKLCYQSPTEDQTKAIEEFLRGKDVLVCLPTGHGKSLCFLALPMLFDAIHQGISNDTSVTQSIIVVISPLKALKKDLMVLVSRAALSIRVRQLLQTSVSLNSLKDIRKFFKASTARLLLINFLLWVAETDFAQIEHSTRDLALAIFLQTICENNS